MFITRLFVNKDDFIKSQNVSIGYPFLSSQDITYVRRFDWQNLDLQNTHWNIFNDLKTLHAEKAWGCFYFKLLFTSFEHNSSLEADSSLAAEYIARLWRIRELSLFLRSHCCFPYFRFQNFRIFESYDVVQDYTSCKEFFLFPTLGACLWHFITDFH